METNSELPIFRPNMEQFVNFANYIKSLENMNISFAKIIPPPEWQAHSKKVAKDYILQKVVNQRAEKLLGGTFHLRTDHSPMSYDEFEEISKQNEIELFGLCGLSGMYVNEIESMHWSRISNERKYSISNNTSLFGDDVVCWNLNKFTRAESNLHSTRPHYELNNPIDGIQSPNIYIGGPLTSFAFHLEDGNAYSINYLHHGAAKVWYFVPPDENRKLENLSRKVSKKVDCDLYIRHKTMMIPPSVLKKHNIKFHRIVQNAGEFIISFPMAYHSGFNCGFNIAEAVNFGTEKWLEVFDDYTTCTCPHSKEFDSPMQAVEALKPIVERIRSSKFTCDECGKTYAEKKQLNYHNKMQHASMLSVYVCPKCPSKKYNAPYALKNHLIATHGMVGIALSKVKTYNKPIKNTKRLKEAKAKKKANFVPRKEQTCIYCGKHFTRVYNHDRHLSYCKGKKAIDEFNGTSNTT